MSIETLIYGLEKGEQRPYMETLLYRAPVRLNEAQIAHVLDYAQKHGWHALRVAYSDLDSAPDFKVAIN